MECLKPLGSYLSGRSIIIAAEPDIHTLVNYRLKPEKLISNAIMASQPRHPFFKYIIDCLVNRTKLYGDDVMWTTGPFMLQDVYDVYNGSNHDKPPNLIEDEIFLPTANPGLKNEFKRVCNNLKSYGIKKLALAKKICVSYLQNRGNKISEKSLTVHHWSTSWVPRFKTGIDKYPKFDINELRKPNRLSR